MSSFQAGNLLDFQAPAYAVISGNASGTTPMPSGWIKVADVESLDVALTTASSTNVTWSAQTATTPDGRDAVALVNPPTWPTGVNQSATVNIVLPAKAKYLKITATPSAGSGAVTATPSMVYGRPAVLRHPKEASVVFDCAAAATLAGQGYLDFSANYNPCTPDQGQLGNLPPKHRR